LDSLLKDLRFGLRTLARRPAFTAVAVLSLGLGMGVTTSMFSVVNAVLLAPIPVHEPERLVEIYTSQASDLPYLTTSYPDFLDLRTSVDAVSALAGHGMVRALYRRGQDRAELVLGEVVSDNYFDVLGVRPALGRSFEPAENRTELSHPVAIVSQGFWQRRLGGKPDVLGQRVELSGVAYTIVGVAPPEFQGTIPGLAPDFWAPLMMVEKLNFSGIQSQTPSPGNTRLEQRGNRWLFVTGRLAPGRTVEEARAQVATVAARLAGENPEVDKDLKGALLPARSVRFHPMIDGVLAPAAALLMAAVGVILLIACANVANMLLARASARRREIAVRLALGAPRGRIVRQLLAESLVLAGLGGAVGLLIAFWTSRLLSVAPLPLPVPLALRFDLDARVLLFAMVASVATTFLFGLVPALRASRPDLVPALRGEAAATRRGFPLRDVLVAGQLALSLVLLVAGALLLRGLAHAHEIRPGFDPDHLAVLSFNLKMNGYSTEQATAFQRRMTERLRALPEVERVSLVSRAPLGSDHSMEGIRIAGVHAPGDEPALVDAAYVEPDYFAALGLSVREGRAFTDADDERAPNVVIVNEALARRYWPGRSAVGQRIYTEGFDGPSYEILGVVPDYKVRDLGEEPRPYLHFAWRQQADRKTTVLVRTAGLATPALAGLRRAVLELEPAVVFSEEGTVADLLRVTLAPARMGATLVSVFAALALMLAAVGIALGALAAAALTRILSSLLYGVSAWDPLAFAAATAVLLSMASVASLVPSRRAARVDPTVALRYE